MRLGQNFLSSKKIAKKIVEAAGIKKDDVILEVGPGKGILTEELLKYSKKVIAVEKDKRLVSYLAVKFDSEIKLGKLILLEGDILKIFNFQFSIFNKFPISNFQFLTFNHKIVANIPYYITSRFLRNFLSAKNQPQKMVLMVQKEVAKRICANPPRMNMLAISVRAYGEPRVLFNVSRKHFSPQPKVDSAVIAIDNISRRFFSGKLNEEKFFKLAKAGFSHKRKLLINNLRKFIECSQSKKELEKTFKKCKIPFKARAENLALSDWKCLTQYLF